MRGRRSPSDVVHVLSLPDLSIEDVQLVLGQAISFFDFDDPAAISNTWVKEVVGVAVEVYRLVTTFWATLLCDPSVSVLLICFIELVLAAQNLPSKKKISLVDGKQLMTFAR